MTTANICRHCKDESDEGYNIQELYKGNRDLIYVVYCPCCQYESIPVVIDRWMGNERYDKFMEAWNNANPAPGKDKE